jgi:hypothetical protein
MDARKFQSQFAKALGKLLRFIDECGDEVTLGDTYPGKFKHKPNGKHPKGLAIDLNLFIKGVLQDTTEAHAKYGAYWKGLGGIWGGDWDSDGIKDPNDWDGNHYEWRDK